MSIIFLILYSLVWTLLVPILTLLALTVIPKWRDGLAMKLGLLPKLKATGYIWMHAVSVGELNALLPLLRQFEGTKLLLSTSTVTAQNMAKKKLKTELAEQKIELIYMPWDHPLIIQTTLNKIKPSVVVLMETEIWPALIHLARAQNIPVAVINARLADASFNAYSKLKIFFQWIFAQLSLVLAQSPADSRKFLQLGVAQDQIYMTGNMKFAAFPAIDESQAVELRDFIGYQKQHKILVAGSTHPEEEIVIIAIFQELKAHFADLRLVIAPRHPERFTTVRDLILSAAQLEVVSFAQLKKYAARLSLSEKFSDAEGVYPKFALANEDERNAADETLQIGSSNDVLLLDTIGDLAAIYGIADIAIVGGTINDTVGGHNVLEPAAYGVPVVIGESYYKNIETVEMMRDANALRIAYSNQELKNHIRSLLENDDLRVLMGANAKNLITRNREILKDTATRLRSIIK